MLDDANTNEESRSSFDRDIGSSTECRQTSLQGHLQTVSNASDDGTGSHSSGNQQALVQERVGQGAMVNDDNIPVVKQLNLSDDPNDASLQQTYQVPTVIHATMIQS